MKKLIAVLTFFVSISAFAQAPEKLSYQAVVTSTNNNLIVNQLVGMQISILKGGASGSVVFSEVHTPTTNSNGLVSIEIGNGTSIVGAFNTIDWSSGPFFVKTETDPLGGTNYTITGISQLLSVPFALHAKTAESVSNDQVDDADADPTNEIELPEGGTDGQLLQTDGNGNYTWVDQIEDTNTQLTEAEVDAYTNNNGYLLTEVDADPTNEIELPEGGTDGQVLKTDGNGNYSWVDQTEDTNTTYTGGSGITISNNVVSTTPGTNMQPYTTVNYIIALQGTYPSRSRPASNQEKAARMASYDPFIGEIILFGGNFAPRGWAFCDGQLLPISQYSALFSILGTTYGGDGRTTFALPDLRGRAPIHAGNGPGLSDRRLGSKGGVE